jgi:hypothetical protein
VATAFWQIIDRQPEKYGHRVMITRRPPAVCLGDRFTALIGCYKCFLKTNAWRAVIFLAATHQKRTQRAAGQILAAPAKGRRTSTKISNCDPKRRRGRGEERKKERSGNKTSPTAFYNKREGRRRRQRVVTGCPVERGRLDGCMSSSITANCTESSERAAAVAKTSQTGKS